jgi:hypothetical protein
MWTPWTIPILNWYKKNPDEKEVLTLISIPSSSEGCWRPTDFCRPRGHDPRADSGLYEQEERDCQVMRARNGEEGVPSLDFEQLIIGFQPNPILTNMHKRLTAFGDLFRRHRRRGPFPGCPHKDHLVIIGAIEKNDPGKIAGA